MTGSLGALSGSSRGKVHRVGEGEGRSIEEVWCRWKEKVLAAAEKGIRREKLWRGQKDGGQTR